MNGSRGGACGCYVDTFGGCGVFVVVSGSCSVCQCFVISRYSFFAYSIACGCLFRGFFWGAWLLVLVSGCGRAHRCFVVACSCFVDV